jgi:hypothetical protein
MIMSLMRKNNEGKIGKHALLLLHRRLMFDELITYLLKFLFDLHARLFDLTYFCDGRERLAGVGTGLISRWIENVGSPSNSNSNKCVPTGKGDPM